jgi:hypothetical protein
MRYVPGPWLLEYAPVPECPVHGRMRLDFAMDRWTCPGFDGEGCGHVVNEEDRDYRPLGIVDQADWGTGG